MNPPIEQSEDANPTALPRRGILRRILRWVGTGVLALVMLGMLLWAALTVYYADTHSGPRTIRAILFVLMSVAAVFLIRPRRYGLAAFAVLFGIVLLWFFSLTPRNDRQWTADGVKAAWAQIDGDHLMLHNVRNFDYRSETDFTERWSDREYDLSKLRSVDFMLVHWGSPAIAHVMVSFCFDDGQFLCASIETRKEQGESYSAVQGFFRQYELIYVFADERDLIGQRTGCRNEDVYLYRTTLTPANARSVLLSYVDRANALAQRPEFYNALTSNCATNVLEHARAGGAPGKLSVDVLLSGYADEQAYRNGGIDRSLPFKELQALSHINAAARAVAAGDPDFSKLIRVGLPNPASVAVGTSATSTPAASRPAP